MQSSVQEKPEQEALLNIPEGGIAEFMAPDDMEDEYGSDGIAQFPALTKKMAAMGREGDDVVAHLQSGEMVIPKQILDDDPALKESLFQRLMDMGVEDPERYVVGSDANSINPDTGAAEFFFGKIIKAVGKAVKSVVKGVVKVVKKVAPVVLPIALSFTPLGPVYGAALGSGIGTLIKGGSIKDALKSALISGATGAVFAGATGPGTFGENVGNALANPGARVGQTISGAKSTLTGGGFTGEGNLFTQYVPAEQSMRLSTNDPVVDTGAADPATGGEPAATATEQTLVTPQEAPTFTESIKDAFTPGGRTFTESLGDAFFPSSTITNAAGEVVRNPTYLDVLGANNINPLNATAAQTAAAREIAAAAAPSMMRSYLPAVVGGTVVAGATGMFDPVPAEPANVVDRDEEGNVITGRDLIDADPSRYLVSDLGSIVLDPETGQYVSRSVAQTQPTYTAPSSVPTNYPMLDQNMGTISTELPGIDPMNSPYLMQSTPGGPFARPQMTAAYGGEVYPRRNGGIMPDEGVPGKDSVRALLMPGEFVMTTDAVRGLGNGDERKGIQNMYKVMRGLEARGRAMA